MWSAGFDVAHVYLGQSLVGFRRRDGEPGEDESWMPCESVLRGWESVAEVLSDARGTSLRRMGVYLWLSGGLARPYMFGPVHGLQRSAEATEIARSLAPESTGLEGPCVAWLDAWQPARTCAAVAMQRALRDEIENVAKRHRIRLKCLRPWWAAVLDAVAAPKEPACQLLAVEDSDALTILAGNDGELDSAATYSPAPPRGEMEAVLTRRRLGAGVETQRVVKARLLQGANDVAANLRPIGLRAPFAMWEALPH